MFFIYVIYRCLDKLSFIIFSFFCGSFSSLALTLDHLYSNSLFTGTCLPDNLYNLIQQQCCFILKITDMLKFCVRIWIFINEMNKYLEKESPVSVLHRSQKHGVESNKIITFRCAVICAAHGFMVYSLLKHLYLLFQPHRFILMNI